MATINTTLNSILNAPITCKRKNVDGKYEQYTTNILEDNFKHIPKANEVADDSAKAAIGAIGKIYEYMESASIATTDNQRDKAMNKAYEYARLYLKAVGMGTGVGNVSMLTSVFAPKKQTTKGIVKGGYTTKSTFVKYALYLSYHFGKSGVWCDAKSTKSTSTSNVKTFDDLVQIYMENFGFSEETAKNLADKARQAKVEIGKVA